MGNLMMLKFKVKHLLVMATLPMAIASTTALPVSPLRPAPALADHHSPRILTVTGESTVAVPTSIAVISLTVETQGLTPTAAQQAMAQRTSALVDFLNTQPISHLATTGISLYPRYDDDDRDEEIIIGYTAVNALQFEIDTPLAGDVLDDAIQAGATHIISVDLRAPEETIVTAQQQALQSATLSAQTNADIVLERLGLIRQNIVRIRISVQTPTIRNSGNVRYLEARTQVIDSTQVVRASVTIEVEY
ncbi:MAG: SIMPL domain-containing protein [Merismopedia sp. SIO2A8]|nr:SIMPL domain-containing protein [Merismopedia sp. SIO2A8]